MKTKFTKKDAQEILNVILNCNPDDKFCGKMSKKMNEFDGDYNQKYEIGRNALRELMMDKQFLTQLTNGIKVELEHGKITPFTNVTNDNLVITGKIALAHLIEDKNYYKKLKKMEAGGNIASKLYQTGANAYRRTFCNGKARDLYDGEIHPFCANFMGPGTRINLPEVRNYPPFNGADRVSKNHDLAYEQAFKLSGDERKEAIRKADEIFLKDIEQYKNEQPYYSIGKSGIKLKENIEDIGVNLGKYTGKKGGKAKKKCKFCKGDGMCKRCQLRGGCGECDGAIPRMLYKKLN